MVRRHSIFCIYNISDQPQTLQLWDLNLIVTDSRKDQISGRCCDEADEMVEMQPYQVLWISNV